MEKKRTPVPESHELFRHQMWLMAELTGIVKDYETRVQLSVMDDFLLSRITKRTNHAKSNKNARAHMFWQMFKRRYLNQFDMEYFGNWTGTNIKIATTIIDKIEQQGATLEEFVDWLFDDFFPKNSGKLTISHVLALSNGVMTSFLTDSADKLKQKLDKKKLGVREDTAMSSFRILYRETGDKELMDMMDNYKDGKIDLFGMEKEIERIKKKHNK